MNACNTNAKESRRLPTKIAYIIDSLKIGGTEKQLIELANRLDRDKFTPIIFFLRDSHSIDAALHRNLNCKQYFLGIKKFFSLDFASKLIEFSNLLKFENIELIQTFFPESTIVGVLVAKYKRFPIIISARRDMGHWHNLLNRSYIKLSNHFVHRVLVNSFAVKDYVTRCENFNSNRVDVIYNGIDTQLYYIKNSGYKIHRSNNNITIGIVSNFARPVKRFDLFIEAMNMIIEKFENVSISVVGEVGISLRNKIPIHLRHFYMFSGTVEDVKPYLAKMDIGVICSDSEGFCNAILEYMAAGVPVVCSNVGGNTEIIKDGFNGFLFNKGDGKSLFQKVSILIQNPLLRDKFSEYGRSEVLEKYDWNRIIQNYENYYGHLKVEYQKGP